MTSGESSKLFATELIACIAHDRSPSVHELFSVARRVWADGSAERDAFGWNRLSSADEDRVRALRVAHAALTGDIDDMD